MDLTLNYDLGTPYKSSSQKARVITEDWVEHNLYCPRCGNKMLCHYTANKPVADFYCEKCGSDFELKSQERTNDFSKKIVDGAYSTMIQRITSLNNPNLFVMSYHNWEVTNFLFIPNYLFTYETIEKRKPLSPEARRAGWTGCNILLDNIPQSGKIFIIKDSAQEDKEKVLQQYERISALRMNNLESRGWILDVLRCIESLPEKDFCLQQMYEFEEQLHEKHPNNNFIKDKIRQQLQYLRDKNIIEFTSRGHYHSLI